ncbi:MAG: trigger factor [Gemmatimonadota bacterium]|nr:trigger factor [Gemmatimonadota bacterium]MDE3005125.1 trigger factor [Gemmatimonadota bacterium]
MNLDVTDLQISIDEQEAWRRVMNVTIPASIVQAEEQRAARQLASRARLKGFRKGRVPTKVIENRFGGALRQEALDKLIGSAYKEALAAQELRPISEGELEDIHYKPEEDLTFAIAFDVEPVVELERLSGFVVERPAVDITAEQVDEVLGRIQEQNGVWQPLEEGKPVEKDLVSVTITRLNDEGEPADDAREYDIVMGSGDAIPDIEASILTLETGETNDFDIAFPDDFPDESRRGDSERVRITLTSRRQMDVPTLDDDLAKQVGDFETLDELTAKVREDMEKEAEQQADAAARSRLLDLIVDANPFDVPASMVRRYSDGIMRDISQIPEERLSEFREQIRPEAERAVKRILLIEQIAQTQSLTASDDDIDDRVEEIAEANNTDAAKVYAELQKAGRIESLERELTEKAVFDFLFEQSEITEAPST